MTIEKRFPCDSEKKKVYVKNYHLYVGGTVGSGVFVLTGLIAREYTGPGVVISWLIAGFGCCFSAMSYAELSCRIPSAGSSYAYVYVALGKHVVLKSIFLLSYTFSTDRSI